MAKYTQELEEALSMGYDAAALIMDIYYQGFEKATKDDGTPVTTADIASNRLIVERIQRAFPLDGIVSEELEELGDKYIE